MQLARVIGEVVSTMKDANLTGMKLLVLQPLAASGEPVGPDAGGARLGRRGRRRDTCSSSAAAKPRSRSIPAEPPTDAAIVGIVDHWDSRTVRCRLSRRMQIARVVGTVVSTQKNRKLEGAKLLLVQPLTLEGDAARRGAAGDRLGRRRRRRAGAGRDRGQGRGRRARGARRPRSTPRSSGSSTPWTVQATKHERRGTAAHRPRDGRAARLAAPVPAPECRAGAPLRVRPPTPAISATRCPRPAGLPDRADRPVQSLRLLPVARPLTIRADPRPADADVPDPPHPPDPIAASHGSRLKPTSISTKARRR